jgi:hypothetical protein
MTKDLHFSRAALFTKRSPRRTRRAAV